MCSVVDIVGASGPPPAAWARLRMSLIQLLRSPSTVVRIVEIPAQITHEALAHPGEGAGRAAYPTPAAPVLPPPTVGAVSCEDTLTTPREADIARGDFSHTHLRGCLVRVRLDGGITYAYGARQGIHRLPATARSPAPALT
ncbi:hypothetical protein GCM10022402_02790 [Salinactinospora qingdaonensis]|uniref:Uncharacterized protein n=1 Tax=Salinactinospora qingdaonensis TaxID=702744 RepID=A0ABP7EV30_9ACTN